MKLCEIAPVFEGGEQFVVYKIVSPESDKSYYGYYKFNGPLSTKADDEKARAAIMKQFLTAADRHDKGRGSAAMVASAGGVDSLDAELIDVHNDEIEAFVQRNNLRLEDSSSVTGPSRFPGTIYDRIKADRPTALARWGQLKELNKVLAKDASVVPGSGYTYQDLIALRDQMNPRMAAQLNTDAQTMLHPQFKQKYFPSSARQ